MYRYLNIFWFFISVCSCATSNVAYKRDFNFSEVKAIVVGNFTSAPKQPNSGAVVANEFIRQLILAGYTVRTLEDMQDGDVILEGNVTEYLPNQRYLVQGDDANLEDKTIIIQTPIELSGKGVYSVGTVFGLKEGNKIIVSNATVGISAYIKDTRTGTIIWSNKYVYEGLDLNAAVESSVRYLVRTLPKIKPF